LGGIKKNGAEALRLYRIAAGQDYVPALFNLGELYAKGMEGLPSNRPEALRWYRKAAALGNASAKEWLARNKKR